MNDTQMEKMQSGEWIPLMDYAMKRGVSLSTLRRHIKANKVLYKVVNGKYFLLMDEDDDFLTPPISTPIVEKKSLESRNDSSAVQFKLTQLERELNQAHEEIAELKMLVALYEEKIGSPSQGNLSG